MERWKALPYIFFKHFEISNTGRLRNSETNYIYKLRLQKKTGLSFCDITVLDNNGLQLRKTIYITKEVATAFVPKPLDADTVDYKATHKEGVSKLNNLAKNLCWKTQSDFSKENMRLNPENRNRLALHQKKVFGVNEPVTVKDGCYYKGERKLSNFIISEIPYKREGIRATIDPPFIMNVQNSSGTNRTIFFNKPITKYHLERAFLSVGNFTFKGIKDNHWQDIINSHSKQASQFFQY
ncbi:hypothetical protein [Tenacibaculum soleae]|uniref:hypothetical protein n=1 Tax=Tenacibaculum soleae TaxID=447689 RepID=UPI0023003656|nr:hypothetical protein [Tenacibaculum soleae]